MASSGKFIQYLITKTMNSINFWNFKLKLVPYNFLFLEDNKSEVSINMESENDRPEAEDTEKIMIIDPETEVSKSL